MEGYPTLSEPELRRLLAEATKPNDEALELLSSHTRELAAHDLRLDGHDSSFAAHNARIGSVENSVSNHSGRLAALEEDSVDYGQRLTAAEQSIQSQLTDIEALQSNQPAVIVRNEAQFAAALLGNKRIIIDGNVFIANQYRLDRPQHMSCLPGSKLIFQHPGYWWDLAAPQTFVDFHAEGVSNDQGYLFNIGGTQRMGADAYLRIARSSFRNMGNVITMTGGSSSPLGPRTWISDVEIENIGSPLFTSFGQEAAISLSWHLGMTVVENLRSKNTHGNPLYFSNSAVPGVHTLGEPGTVKGCFLQDYNRNGVETFSAARFDVSFNNLKGGTGSFANTPSGSGIGISLAGGYSTAIGNKLVDTYVYGMEVYNKKNLVSSNTIERLTADISSARACVGMSIDNCFDSLITGNNFIDLMHKGFPQYAMRLSLASRIKVLGNNFHNVSYGCWVATLCENNTFQGNVMEIETDPTSPALGYATPAYYTFSDAGQIVMLNTVRVGPNLALTATPTSKQNMFFWTNGCGGFYDFTSGVQLAGAPGIGFGNASMNLVV